MNQVKVVCLRILIRQNLISYLGKFAIRGKSDLFSRTKNPVFCRTSCNNKLQRAFSRLYHFGQMQERVPSARGIRSPSRLCSGSLGRAFGSACRIAAASSPATHLGGALIAAPIRISKRGVAYGYPAGRPTVYTLFCNVP